MMNTSSTSLCPVCGVTLPDNSPQGLCPRCLLAGAMESPAQPPASPSEEVITAQIAAAFPHLEILELLGAGGMGRVYKARQPGLDRTVALKVLPPEQSGDPDWTMRFTREARALARLNHAHIVQVYDFGSVVIGTQDQPYLLMEYVDGVNLRQAMQTGGLTAREALCIVPKLCDALQYAHDHDVLHRDIKPENILIDSEGRVKIADFGLAKLRDEAVIGFTLTQSGAKLGTLAYMAPEQIERPGSVDHRADIYSLGVVFYEMLTGELPLGRFPAPSECGGSDPRLDSVVFRTLEKQRDKRYQTAGDMRTGIEQAGRPQSVGTAEPLLEMNFDYRTEASLWGMPLLHVAFGKDPATGRMRRAQGIVAVGGYARGILALGVISQGIVSWGVLSMGLLSFGVLSFGMLLSMGVLAVSLVMGHGVLALAPWAGGVTALGYIATEGRAWGEQAVHLAPAADPPAVAFFKFWGLPLQRVAALTSGLGLTLMMLLSAWAVYQTAKPNAGRHRIVIALLLALSLLGPLGYFTIKPVNAQLDVGVKTADLKRRAEARKRQEDRQQWQKAADAVHKKAGEWVKQMMRTDSALAREEALNQMLAALKSDNDIDIRAALIATMRSEQVEIVKTGLREAARQHMDSKIPEIRSLAISALMAAEPEPADHERLLAMAPACTEAEIGALTASLAAMSEKDLTGRYSAPILALMERGFAAGVRDYGNSYGFDHRVVLQPLWGARLSPAIEAKIIEWTRLHADESGNMQTGGPAYDAFYYVLSTQANKSEASVKRLLELVQHPDTTNIAGRCLWGMRGTVAKAQQAMVAEAVIRLLENRNDGYLWRQGLGLLRDFATITQAPAIESLANRPQQDRENGAALKEILALARTRS